MDMKRLGKLAAAGRIGRREFIQFGLAAGLTVAAADQLFVSALRAEPKKGGSFRAGIGHGSTTDSLDPATWENSFTGDIGPLLADRLAEIDQTNNVAPGLAESWEADKGAKTWMFKLKKDIEFHSGKTMTAKDVIASFNHHRGEDTKSAVKSVLDPIADIRADGDHTIIFELESGSADFPYITSDYHLPILQSDDEGRVDWANFVATGPYKLDSYNPGVRLKAKRNPNYHGEAWFDDVEMLTIGDVVARMNALNSGDVHFIDRPDLKTIGLLKRNDKIEIDSITGFAHYVAPMRTDTAPFDNVDVRKAVKYAIDREAIVKKVLLGYGKPGNDNPIAPSIRFATNPEPVHRFDPEKAKFHLGKAGLNTLKIDLSASDAAFAGGVDAAVLIAESAKAAGIEINVVREPSDGYWSNVWMKKPWCLSYWGGRPTVDWMMTTGYAADAAWNDTYWKNDRFNELLVDARAETDPESRAAMYAEIQQILHDDGGIIVLMFNDWVTAHSKLVAHGDLNSNYDHDGGYIYKRWWFT